MDALEKIKNKYKNSENNESFILPDEEVVKNNTSSVIDPPQELIENVKTDNEINSWRDSESIILLSEYLKENEKVFSNRQF